MSSGSLSSQRCSLGYRRVHGIKKLDEHSYRLFPLKEKRTNHKKEGGYESGFFRNVSCHG